MAATASWQPSLHDNGAEARRGEGLGLGQRRQSYRREDQKHELMMMTSVGDGLSGFTEGGS
jgi:hypothetical protein